MTANIYQLDRVALNDVRKKKIGAFYALRHKESGLFFHKRGGLNYAECFVATYPMYRQKGVWTNWLKYFEKPQDWELVEVGF